MSFASPVSDADINRRYRALRVRLGRLKSSNYDISNICNLTCEGCLYFARAEGEAAPQDGKDADWDHLFRHEQQRGINFAYIAGAEPTLTPKRIRSAWENIPAGVVFSNGTRAIDKDIGYRIHVSLWGHGERSQALRGADVNGKAMRNYAGDPRAVFVMTVNALNIGDIALIARQCADHGVTLTFSFYSPTTAYNLYAGSTDKVGTDYLRMSATAEDDPRLDAVSMARARDAIGVAMLKYPDTIRYSMHYNDWISRPLEEICTIGPDNIAVDCGNRLTRWHRHYSSDATPNQGKCCSPNIDCRECRAYAMGFATYLTRHREFSRSADEFRNWVSSLELWADMFMPLPTAAAAKIDSAA